MWKWKARIAVPGKGREPETFTVFASSSRQDAIFAAGMVAGHEFGLRPKLISIDPDLAAMSFLDMLGDGQWHEIPYARTGITDRMRAEVKELIAAGKLDIGLQTPGNIPLYRLKKHT